MTCGEKIRYYRNAINMSLEELGKLSGIYPDTIKKYEHGQRNPKPDQLKKIAWALGISVYFLMDLEIETISDVLAILYHLDRQVDMVVDGKRDEGHLLIPGTVSFRFTNTDLSRYIAEAVDTRDTITALEGASSAEGDKAAGLLREQLRHLINFPQQVTKGTKDVILVGPKKTDLYPELAQNDSADGSSPAGSDAKKDE